MKWLTTVGYSQAEVEAMAGEGAVYLGLAEAAGSA
jgi:hypothetical protein